MEQWISAALASSGLEDLPAARLEMLEAFVGEVAIWSEKIHLLGKGRLQENLRLQTLDSLLLLAAAEREAADAFAAPEARLADIGSGAGFPGLVWKIAKPEIRAVLFERRLKAHIFLERTIAVLGLSGTEAREGDAAACAGVGSFGIVTSKAAGRLDAMLPIAERLLAPRGIYVTIKGASRGKELDFSRSGAMRPFAEIELPEKRGLALLFRKSE